jgi:hypothetical protein
VPRPTRTAAAAALAATVVAAASGCAGHGAPAPRTTPAHSHTAAPAPTPGLTGTRLAALLPAPAQLATGVTITGTTDTGAAWTAPAHLPPPALSSADCQAAPELSADVLTADYRAAQASEVLDNNGNSLQLVLAATNPGDAAKTLGEVRAFAARCQSFTVPDPSGSGTETASLALDTFASLGDEAIRLRVTGDGATPDPEVVLVRVGEVIAAVSDTDLAANEAATISAAHYLAARLAGAPA